jgi:hypothetical protein
MATAIVQSGNYSLEIDAGFQIDAFTLDNTQRGVLDNTTYVLDGTTQFADVTDGTLNISITRGRKDSGDQFAAGTMNFTLNDTLADGVFNPFDQNSPYYDENAGVPGLAPMRQVRLTRFDSSNNPERLFVGRIVNYNYNFQLGGLNTVQVNCADEFYLLAQTALNELNVSPELSGERIETILDLPEVDFPTGPTARNIDPGTVELGHDSAYTIPAGTNTLGYITQINETAEFGRVFMSRAGVFTFQPRIGTTLSGPVVEFTDTTVGYPYDKLGISFQADNVTNRVVVTGLDGTSSTATDAGSIATYFIQTNSITNSLLHNAGDIATAASYLLEPDPEARYTDVSTAFTMLTTAERDTVAIIDIGDTISISKSFPSGVGTTSLAQELSVEGIEHQIDFNTGHRVHYWTAPTTIVFELILDDPQYGILDALNVLG